MSHHEASISRRSLVAGAGAATGGSLLATGAPAVAAAPVTKKRRYAIVGTGWRGTGMWGADLAKNYGDVLEFVGLCDINPKRALLGRQRIGVTCPTYTSFDEMCDKT